MADTLATDLLLRLLPRIAQQVVEVAPLVELDDDELLGIQAHPCCMPSGEASR